MPAIPDLSVQLYSVRHHLAADFGGTVGRVAEIGLTRVEPSGLLGVAEQLRAALAATGMSAPTAHQVLDGSEGNLDEIFAVARELGVEVLIHPYSADHRWVSREYLQELADMLGAAAAAAREHGMRVGYHNHAWELSNHIDGRHALELFMDLLDPAVVLEVDAYWAATGGADVPTLLQRLGNRVVALHLKDGRPLSGDISAQLPLGSGDLPVEAVVAAAPSLEYPVLEFDEYDGDIFEGIATGYGYATSVLGAQR